jgi:hypothetical protein
MGYDVTSWFYDQCQEKSAQPKKVFMIGDSDYSDGVLKWPTFKRIANRIVASKATIRLDNADGEMNYFHERLWSMPNTCSVQLGFTHPTSGDELLTLFSGEIKEVKYNNAAINIHLRDRFWGLTEKKVGDSADPAIFSSQIPSDIAWTLCASYGQLSGVQSDSNPHIDWDSFNAWAEQFSTDSIEMEARYKGIKTAEALERLGKMTDSAIWTEGDGKLYFKRYTEPDSLDFLIDQDQFSDLEIKIDGLRPVNKAWVYGGYSPSSNYWQINVFNVDTTAVNTYGLHEEVFKDDTIWYVNSASAQNLAQRIVLKLKYPPKRFKIKTTMIGMHRQIGETVRLVDSFYAINSGTGWRYDEITVNVDTGGFTYAMNEAIAGNAFYLDYSDLDGDDLLL